MAIPNKQIGWSNEANLLWYIAKELEQIKGQLNRLPSSPTTTTTTTQGQVYQFNGNGTGSFNLTCQGYGSTIAYSSAATLAVGVQLFSDNTLTTPYTHASDFKTYSDPTVWNVDSNGFITSISGTC